MRTLTDELDAFPDEIIDTLDELTGMPLVGSGDLTCETVESDPDFFCELDASPLVPFEHCVICTGGMTIPNRERQMKVNEWCD